MNRPYQLADREPNDWSGYETLDGPDGFSVTLTEPEDRSFCRDLNDVITRLNDQHETIERLNARINSLILRPSSLDTK